MRQVRLTVTRLGAAAAMLAAVVVSTSAADAMPLATAPANVLSAFRVDAAYYGYRYRGYRHYRGRAGVYRCGPNAFKTHLSRKYC